MQIEFSSDLSNPIPASLSNAATAEYIIYAYNHYEDEDIGRNRWQRVSTTTDSKLAQEQAELLFWSQKYQKVEIKKKIFDEKKGRNISSTFKNFENKPKRNYLTLATIMLLAFTSVGIFYLNVS